jgi:hypothetical protein
MSYTMSNRCFKQVINFEHRFGRARKIEQRRQQPKLSPSSRAALSSSTACHRRAQPHRPQVDDRTVMLGSTTIARWTTNPQTRRSKFYGDTNGRRHGRTSRSMNAQAGDGRGVGGRWWRRGVGATTASSTVEARQSVIKFVILKKIGLLRSICNLWNALTLAFGTLIAESKLVASLLLLRRLLAYIFHSATFWELHV